MRISLHAASSLLTRSTGRKDEDHLWREFAKRFGSLDRRLFGACFARKGPGGLLIHDVDGKAEAITLCPG